MPIEIKCPGCGRAYVLADNLGGEIVVCTQCRGSMQVADVEPDGGLATAEVDLSAEEPKGGLRRSIFEVSLFVGVALLIGAGVVLIMILPDFRDWGERRKAAACAANMRRIGAAMIAYSLDNADRLPCDMRGPLYSLTLLYPAYLPDPTVFVCPSPQPAASAFATQFPPDSALAGRMCSYIYDFVAARASESSDLDPDVVIMTEPAGSHGREGGSVLFADGHVEWRVGPPG